MGHFSLAIASLWDTRGGYCLIVEAPVLSNPAFGAFFKFKSAMEFDVAFKSAGLIIFAKVSIVDCAGMVYGGKFSILWVCDECWSESTL